MKCLCVDHDSVSPYGRCPLTGGYKCSVCVDHDSVSPYGRCPLTVGYKCSVCVWTMTQCPLMGGVPILQVTNEVFVCGP